MPTFFKDFLCVGSACKDTFCSDFQIYIDKETFKKYEAMNVGHLTANIELNPQSKNDMDYGLLKRNDKRCSLLTSENLCSLQIQFGHESLCNTCKSYPRINNLLGTDIEKSLAMTCPEVVRMLLSLKQGIDFEIIEDNSNYNIKKYIKNDISDIVFNIRLICIQLMQERSYSTEMRLFRIGLFIEGFVSCSNEEQLPYLLNDYEKYLRSKEITKEKEFDKIKKIIISKYLIENTLNKEQSNIRYKNINSSFLTVFAGTEIEILDTYVKTEIMYEDFLVKYDYFLENIFVNFMFQEIFPFDNENILESYYILLFRYGIIKSKIFNLLITNQITEESLVTIIQSYFKMYDHSSEYMKKLYKIFYKKNPSFDQIVKDFLS